MADFDIRYGTAESNARASDIQPQLSTQEGIFILGPGHESIGFVSFGQLVRSSADTSVEDAALSADTVIGYSFESHLLTDVYRATVGRFPLLHGGSYAILNTDASSVFPIGGWLDKPHRKCGCFHSPGRCPLNS